MAVSGRNGVLTWYRSFAVIFTVWMVFAVHALRADGGHFLPHRHGMTTVQKVAYFRRSLRHERQVIRWLHSRQAPRTLQRRSELHWFRRALAWHTRLLRRYSAKLVPSRHVTQPYGGTVAGAICAIFGPYCQQALAVATCESGLSVYARNGQYKGIFQMGATERATYGDSITAYGQAQAAYRYFLASGSDWSPWTCKP